MEGSSKRKTKKMKKNNGQDTDKSQLTDASLHSVESSSTGFTVYKNPPLNQQLNMNFASLSTLNVSAANGHGKPGPSSKPATSAKVKRDKKREKKKMGQKVPGMQKDSLQPPSKKRRVATAVVPSTANESVEEIIELEENGVVNHEDSKKTSDVFFKWLLHPFSKETFMSKIWEKQPLLIQRDNPFYFKHIFSCTEFDRILRKESLLYSKNIDVTEYKDGQRQTINPVGRAFAGAVWDYFESGYSIRLLNPQTYSHSVWKLCSTLQGFFGCFVGANVYLTPKGTQGFAPHYDDIEAFVLQLEGTKKWKVYKPRSKSEKLPRFSSPNFTEDEIGEPVLEVELKPGDVLYFPRGFIHQASSSDEIHSLHITVSTYQKNSWGDFLEKLLPAALQLAISEDPEFRRGLPLNYLQHVGIAYSDDDEDTQSEERSNFMHTLGRLMKKVTKYVPVDAAADQMAKAYVHCSLPPFVSKEERLCSIHGAGEKWQGGKVTNKVSLDPDTEMRLIRPDVLRIVTEEETIRVYYSSCNSRVYQENEPFCSEVSEQHSEGIEYLIKKYPEFSAIENIPVQDETSRMELAAWLYNTGLVITKEVLLPDEED